MQALGAHSVWGWGLIPVSACLQKAVLAPWWIFAWWRRDQPFCGWPGGLALSAPRATASFILCKVRVWSLQGSVLPGHPALVQPPGQREVCRDTCPECCGCVPTHLHRHACAGCGVRVCAEAWMQPVYSTPGGFMRKGQGVCLGMHNGCSTWGPGSRLLSQPGTGLEPHTWQPHPGLRRSRGCPCPGPLPSLFLVLPTPGTDWHP